MRYHQMGRVPRKRHVQFRDPEASSANGDAPLLVEEVLGFEGFSGNESILYHLWSPCRVKDVGDFTPIEPLADDCLLDDSVRIANLPLARAA